jgi:hypothetical protein
MSKHTQSPWLAQNADIVDATHSGHIASIHRFRGEWEWNARLIASAPELLTACRRALTSIEANGFADELPLAVNALKSAISKADGES